MKKAFASIITFLVIYTMVLTILDVVSPTDYPHQDGDWSFNIAKISISILAATTAVIAYLRSKNTERIHEKKHISQ